jgi:sRNA-binding protein
MKRKPALEGGREVIATLQHSFIKTFNQFIQII